MHPLAAPGTLWVLSSDGKYLVRPQADETSHKKQTACGRQEKGLPCLSRITKDFASAEATRGLSDRPLDPFGAHLLYAWAKPATRNRLSCGRQGKGLPFLPRIAKGFASAEATRGLSGRSATSIGAAFRRLFRLRKAGMLSRHWRLCLPFPLDPFGAHPCMRGRNLPQETPSLWQA